MKTVQFIRIIDNESIILTSKNPTNIQSGEIVIINGLRYITKLL
jgi:hypothetical protein